MSKAKVNKSAKDGRFVSNKEVKNKPSTTYVQTVEKKSKSKAGSKKKATKSAAKKKK